MRRPSISSRSSRRAVRQGDHRYEAERARRFHVATGRRLQNVEACVASLKGGADG